LHNRYNVGECGLHGSFGSVALPRVNVTAVRPALVVALEALNAERTAEVRKRLVAMVAQSMECRIVVGRGCCWLGVIDGVVSMWEHV